MPAPGQRLRNWRAIVNVRRGVSTKPNTPAWRRAFDAVERRIARPVESGVRTDAFNDTMTVLFRTRRELQRAIEKRTRHALHLVNLPTATDVKRLSEQVAALHREVRALERERDERDERARR
jgi:hypothetical protein